MWVSTILKKKVFALMIAQEEKPGRCVCVCGGGGRGTFLHEVIAR